MSRRDEGAAELRDRWRVAVPRAVVAVLAVGVFLVAACATVDAGQRPEATTRLPVASFVISAYETAPGPRAGVVKVRDPVTGRYGVAPWSPSGPPVPSPDGTLLAFADPGGGARLGVLPIHAGRPAWARTPAAPRVLAWSPDGTRVAVFGPSAVTVVDARTRATRTVALRSPAGAAGPPTDGIWTADGAGFAVSWPYGAGDRLAFYSAAGVLRRTIPVAGVPIPGRPWSPSGRAIAVLGEPSRGGSAAPVVAVDVATGRELGRFVDGTPVEWVDETHLAVAVPYTGRPVIASLDLRGRHFRWLSFLPADASVQPPVYLAGPG